MFTAAVIMGRLAEKGYVVIGSQYRGNKGGEGKEQFGGLDVNDVTILPKVLAEIKGVDTSRIGMYGWSRGGMMSYRAITEMSNIKAVVVGGAMANSFESIKDRPGMEGVYEALVPDYHQNKQQALTDQSASLWVDKFPKDVPFLLLHGNADWRVKPKHSYLMAMEFDKYRIPYRLMVFEGSDHGISDKRMEVFEATLSWFDRFVKNGEAIPNMDFKGK